MRRPSCCSHTGPQDSKITLYLLVSPQASELAHADMQKEQSSKGGTAFLEVPVLSSISKLSQAQSALEHCPI